jgi:PleD family two-component response regulator
MSLLVIDDDPQVTDLLRQLLEKDQRCVTVSSAEEALTLMEAEKFAVVISDINMPGLSGLELLPLARLRSPDTVVIMISGSNGIESAIEAMRAGAFDYILKPFDLRQVEASVTRALEHHSLLVFKREHDEHVERTLRLRTEELEHLCYYDDLTGLPNKTLYKNLLARALVSAPRDELDGRANTSGNRRVQKNQRNARAAGGRPIAEGGGGAPLRRARRRDSRGPV